MAIADLIHLLAGHQAAPTHQGTIHHNSHDQLGNTQPHSTNDHHDTSHTTAHNFLSQLSQVGHTGQQGLVHPASQHHTAQGQSGPFADGSIASSLVGVQSLNEGTLSTSGVHSHGLLMVHAHALTCGDYNI